MDKLTKMVNGESVELGPLEEAEIRAHWAIGDHEMTRPIPISNEEKLNALIDPNQGLDYIQKRIAQYESDKLAYDQKLLELQNEYQKCYDEFYRVMESMHEDCKTC